MSELKQNYYGSLCTEMYEILHEQAPQDELDFYLSYAEKGKKIEDVPRNFAEDERIAGSRREICVCS